MSVVRDCLFNIFAATLHIGGGSSIRKLRVRHDVVSGGTGFPNSASLTVVFNDKPVYKSVASNFSLLAFSLNTEDQKQGYS